MYMFNKIKGKLKKALSGNSVRAEIRENSLVAGNPVKTSSLNVASASEPVYTDSNSNLAVGDFPFAIPFVAQATTDPAHSISGTPNGNIMTQTLVAGASATTATAAGWYRITIVSANEAIMSSGAYYVPLVTLT